MTFIAHLRKLLDDPLVESIIWGDANQIRVFTSHASISKDLRTVFSHGNMSSLQR